MNRQHEFEVWRIKVDKAIDDIIGMHSNDLPDFDYWAAFDSGDSPTEAAEAAVKAAMAF